MEHDQFQFRLVSIDYNMQNPEKRFDILDLPFTGTSNSITNKAVAKFKVPIIRLFGTTESNQVDF